MSRTECRGINWVKKVTFWGYITLFAELQEPSFYQIIQFFQGPNAGDVLFCEKQNSDGG